MKQPAQRLLDSRRNVNAVHLLRLLVLCGFYLLCAGGCGGPATNGDETGEDATPPGAAGDGVSETWYALYLDADKIGYQHTRRKSVQDEGRKLVEIEREQVMNALRFAGQSEMRITTRALETPQGEVIRFESLSRLGKTDIKLSGQVDGGRLQIETQTAGGVQSESMPWSEATGGTMAWETSLAEDPLEPGEMRSLKAFEIGLDRAQVANVDLRADRYEETQTLDGPQALLRVDVTTTYTGKGDSIRLVTWCDKQGNILKMQFSFSGKQMTAYAASRETALAEGGPLTVDIALAATVKVQRKLENPHGTRRIVYRARLPEGDPSAEFLTTAGQSVEKLDEHTARITVQAVRPAAGPAPPAEATNPADVAPNALIESDAPAVVALARAAAPSERDPWKVAIALEKLVATHVQSDDFATALGTAAEAARTRKGDCTEHAMLLAAVCRARKIPARVAIGLIYFDPPNKPEQRGFAYHMWTKVSINGQWISIDATLGQGGIGAAHLTLVETNFKDAGIDAFLPVLNVIGKLELEIVEVE
jgi:hypothetical protein